MPKTLRVATDVGGTFTDLVAVETGGEGPPRLIAAKVDTTPPDFEQGVLGVLAKAGIRPAEIASLAHGTTVVINALTERKGVKVGLVTTEGFRDSLEIARGNRPDFFNLFYEKPKPFVPRHLRREVPGRMTYRGQERQPLDLSGLAEIVADFQAEGVEAVALSFLHAYANPAHEVAALAELRRLWPEVPAVAGHQITREWREYERTNTAVLSAYVQPVAARYLRRLEAALTAEGFAGAPYIMQSNCGVDSLAATAEIPIAMVESGPASGMLGAAALGRLIGVPDILALDIGGTTAKCALIEGGEVTVKTDYWIERDRRSAGYPIMVPVVDLVEIGQGGGSVAWVDDFGKLHVGPRSAGARPGPAAYGRGGTEATTTDANLWLGRIDRDYFCGGAVEADMAACEAALARVAKSLGVSVEAAARGIVRLANDKMVNALKLVSLNRGHDPRDFALAAFGGGGGLHAVALARELGIGEVIVPAHAAVFSAWGMTMSDLRRDRFVTRLADLAPGAAAGIEAAFAAAEAEVAARFAAEGVAPETLRHQRRARFRYQNQEHTTEIPLDGGPVTEERLAGIAAAFHEAYEREYTYRLAAGVEMVGLHLVTTAEIAKPPLTEAPLGPEDPDPAEKGRRAVDFAPEGVFEARIYDAGRLAPGMVLEGPAIVEDPGTTTVLPPGCRARVDGYANLRIST